MDDGGHGTSCAGIVAGNGSSGSQTGVAPGAQIMAIKVLQASGSGSEIRVWNGIQFAVENGAHVLSLSLGWKNWYNPDKATWRNIMNNTLAAGVIASVAAGNDGAFNVPPYNVPYNIQTPGNCPSPWLHPDQTLFGGISAVVCVGATQTNDTIAYSSSIGPTTWQTVNPYNDYPYEPEMGLIKPDIVAPGIDVLTLSHANISGYKLFGGTSATTPCVAGVMALIISKNPDISPLEISQVIEETATTLSSTTVKNNVYGSGLINAISAVNAINPSGDANCDGIVNVLDTTTILNYILGQNPDPFCFNNADISGDGIINILDVIVLVNIFILSQ